MLLLCKPLALFLLLITFLVSLLLWQFCHCCWELELFHSWPTNVLCLAFKTSHPPIVLFQVTIKCSSPINRVWFKPSSVPVIFNIFSVLLQFSKMCHCWEFSDEILLSHSLTPIPSLASFGFLVLSHPLCSIISLFASHLPALALNVSFACSGCWVLNKNVHLFIFPDFSSSFMLNSQDQHLQLPVIFVFFCSNGYKSASKQFTFQ